MRLVGAHRVGREVCLERGDPELRSDEDVVRRVSVTQAREQLPERRIVNLGINVIDLANAGAHE